MTVLYVLILWIYCILNCNTVHFSRWHFNSYPNANEHWRRQLLNSWVLHNPASKWGLLNEDDYSPLKEIILQVLLERTSTLHNTTTLTVEESEGFQAQEEEQQDNIQYQIGLWVREDHSYNQQSKHWLLHGSNLNL